MGWAQGLPHHRRPHTQLSPTLLSLQLKPWLLLAPSSSMGPHFSPRHDTKSLAIVFGSPGPPFPSHGWRVGRCITDNTGCSALSWRRRGGFWGCPLQSVVPKEPLGCHLRCPECQACVDAQAGASAVTLSMGLPSSPCGCVGLPKVYEGVLLHGDRPAPTVDGASTIHWTWMLHLCSLGTSSLPCALNLLLASVRLAEPGLSHHAGGSAGG